MFIRPAALIFATVLLGGCESSTSDGSEDISDLSPTTAAFLNQEVVAAESGATVIIEVVREDLGEITSIPVTFSGTSTEADYRVIRGIPVTFSERSLTSNIEIEIIEDFITEGGESLILELQDPSTGAVDRTANRFFIGITGNSSFINDTGVTRIINSAPAMGQDAMFGLDVNATDADGQNGLVLTALDNSANPVSPPGICVRDENTGNSWTSPATITDIPWPEAERMNTANQYSWYEPDNLVNGGSPGFRTNQPLNVQWPVNSRCAYRPSGERTGSVYCDTNSLVNEFNEFGVCSFRNWRLPTAIELISIIDFEPVENSQFPITLYTPLRDGIVANEINIASPTDEQQIILDQLRPTVVTRTAQTSFPPFDPTYWPAIKPGTYATSTPTADGTASIICVNYNGISTTVQRCNKLEPTLRVLLTRTAQADQTDTL